MDTGARLVIFAIVEKNYGVMIKWRPGGVCGRLTHVIMSMSIKDRTVVDASNKIKCMPIT